jgi:DNA-binding PadR family transcriptional regulator
MNRSKYLPLTETTYLILVALIEPGHGYLIMQKVEELSEGNVRIAAGTMYGAIENLIKLKWIKAVPSEDKRRKVYQITDAGLDILKEETNRLRTMVAIADANKL